MSVSSQVKPVGVLFLFSILSFGAIFFSPDRSLNAQSADPTQFIENGDFADGLTGWIELLGGSAAPVIDQNSQSVFLEDTVILQKNINVSEHGVYEVSFNCKGTSSNSSLVSLMDDSGDKISLPFSDIPCGPEVTQLTSTLGLIPETYEIVFQGLNVFLDDVSLTFSADYQDIDTGLINNGDFVGTEGWETLPEDDTLAFVPFDGATANGAIEGGMKQTRIEIPAAGDYLFSFTCRDDSEEPQEVYFEFKTSPSDPQGIVQAYTCDQPDQEFELTFSVAASTYQLVIVAPLNPDTYTWIDDVTLTSADQIEPEVTPTMTATPEIAPTFTPTATSTETAVPTASATLTVAPTETAEPTSTPVGTATPAVTPEATRTQTATPMATVINPSLTPDPAASDSNLFMPIIRLDE